MTEAETVRFISDMTRETLSGKLVWTRGKVPDSIGTKSLIPPPCIYTTNFKTWRIGVYEITYRDYLGETDEWYTTSRIDVALLSQYSNDAEYVFHQVSGTFDLMQAIQAQSVNVRAFFDAWKKDQNGD
ncbi:hypothetical protein [Myxococcus xanthus]|uniref:hypothetical protein n=1 Tax=Myxococcus xanthus TaxID=34 RepID=UPI00112690A5|nr:hypothetical protein [Myxococcus xanthus]